MTKTLKLFHWNINQKYMANTPPMILAEIIHQNADIVVLTEFYKTPNFYEILVNPLQEYGYRVFLDYRPAKDKIRQVLIAIRKIFITDQAIEPNILDDNQKNIKNGIYPNFLSIDFILDNVPITVIGTRIRIWNSEGKEEQQRRQKQFNELLGQIPHNREVIILGDMNISENYTGENWHYETVYKRGLKDAQLTLHVPTNGCSPLHSDKKLDHLIISNGIKTDNANKLQYIEVDSWPQGINYPDHPMLIAEVSLHAAEETTTYNCPNCGNEIIEKGTYSIPPFCENCKD